MNLLLYAVTVLIWGTTWIAIKWQLGRGAAAGVHCLAFLDRGAGAVRAAAHHAPADLAAARRMALPGRARTWRSSV